MSRIAYVAGKITGLAKEDVKNKFNMITNQLLSMGYHVEHPSAVHNDKHTWPDAIRGDIKKMLECDEVHMLPDWQESRGAQLERDIALRLGMQIVYH